MQTLRGTTVKTGQKMFFENRLSRIFFFACSLYGVFALPEPGVWKDVSVSNDIPYLYFVKNMYKDTIISVEINCTPGQDENDVELEVGWLLRHSPCTQEYHNIDDMKETGTVIDQYYNTPYINLYADYKYKTIQYQKFDGKATCSAGKTINLPDKTKEPPQNKTALQATVNSDESATAKKSEQGSSDTKDTITDSPSTSASGADKKQTGTKPESASNDKPNRKKRADTKNPDNGTTDSSIEDESELFPPPPKADDQKSEYHVAKVWKSGAYIFILKIGRVDKKSVDAKVTIRMKSKVGYISAFEWPLIIFYGVMGLVYIIYGVVWLVMLSCNWRDLLRIQYWIGAVIVLGMLEKAVFFSEYQSISDTGTSVTDGAEVFAEIVSCLKRSLARMLVIIASLGFGIVKPRLGPAFHKVLFVGGLYFVIATVEACMRSLRRKGDQSTDLMLAQVPLAVLDAAICWWIFSSLMQTIRQLRLRRNIVKLTLYRHFTNTLIFAILASIIFMIWSLIQIKRPVCLEDWQELWIDDAFWHLLFSIILLVIMILWRPSSNNQRYAFSPLLDAADDDEEDETVMNDAFDGMKMRTKQVNGSPKQKQNTIEDDLKWVEENIPAAISDKASTLLDSDEEIMTAKYEMSKMQ